MDVNNWPVIHSGQHFGNRSYLIVIVPLKIIPFGLCGSKNLKNGKIHGFNSEISPVVSVGHIMGEWHITLVRTF